MSRPPDAEHPRREGGGAANQTGQDSFEAQSTTEDGDGDYYARIPEWLLDSEHLSAGAVRLYGILDLYCDNSEGQGDHLCFPSRGTLARRIGRSRASVDRFVAELVEVGAVVVTPRTSPDGDPTSNLYYLAPRTRLRGPRDAATPSSGMGPGWPQGRGQGGPKDAAQKENQLDPQEVELDPLEGEVVDLAVKLISDHGPANQPPSKRRDEMRVTVRRATAKHGVSKVVEALRTFPPGAYTYAREVLLDLYSALEDPPCPKCHGTGQLSSGYLCGCAQTRRRAS